MDHLRTGGHRLCCGHDITSLGLLPLQPRTCSCPTHTSKMSSTLTASTPTKGITMVYVSLIQWSLVQGLILSRLCDYVSCNDISQPKNSHTNPRSLSSFGFFDQILQMSRKNLIRIKSKKKNLEKKIPKSEQDRGTRWACVAKPCLLIFSTQTHDTMLCLIYNKLLIHRTRLVY